MRSLQPDPASLASSPENAMTHFASSATAPATVAGPAPDIEARRAAYNAAFHELGVDWFWDAGCSLLDGDDERVCLRGYLARYQPHLLTVYDADFLVDAILAAKTRCSPQRAAAAGKAGAATDWRELQQRQIGV
jgi:hypothetical protein